MIELVDAAIPPPTPPTAKHLVGIPLILPVEGDLVADEEVSLFAIVVKAFDGSCASTDCLVSASTIWFG
jgi:hypothetical protein